MSPHLPIEEMLLRATEEFPEAEECASFLDWACRGDEELRRRIDQLLALRKHSEAFFDFQPFAIAHGDHDQAIDEAETGTEIGLRIGRYRLIRRLGEGGCGVVYQAEQETPVKRQVALKLIRMGLDHEQVITRFERERQALAMMDHPGIARVLDAGATPTGRPYFVMQWVSGEPVTDFCDIHRLSIRQRLQVFIRICRAIQHAHQKGVVHRDIKPSNVLASFHDGAPLPKVIDFGIAKISASISPLIDDESDAVLGTPSYMSPEQRQSGGLDVDTRTDIYSLGVLLCELLIARTPFHPSKITTKPHHTANQNFEPRVIQSMKQWLIDCSPAELAQLAAARSCRPQQLIHLIQGDLDAIVMKCLQTDRQQRYDTPNALANDIQRHLDDKIISAYQPDWWTRTSKLLRRQRWFFAIGGVAFLTLAAGFGTSTWLFFRESAARQEQVQLRAEADLARSQEAALRAQSEAREACAQAAVKLFYDQFQEADQLLAEIPTDLVPPSLESADAYRKLGDWHRKAGRMVLAAKRYTALAQSMSTVDRSDLHQVSSELLPAAVATCAVKDHVSYDQVRQVALDRFGITQDRIVAEQMIKACLLQPADSPTMAKIAKLTSFLQKSIGETSENEGADDSAAWHCYSLALWYHRLYDSANAKHWAQLSLQRSSQDPARTSCVNFLLAMTLHRQGETERAHQLLDSTASPLLALRKETANRWSDDLGRWLDWTNAHLLLIEAQNELSGPSPSAPDLTPAE